MAEPENLVLQILRELRADMNALRADMNAGFADVRAAMRSEIGSLRADVASDLVSAQAKSDAQHKETRQHIVGLRRAVVEYHSAVVGHGILIGDLEERVGRIEARLDATP